MNTKPHGTDTIRLESLARADRNGIRRGDDASRAAGIQMPYRHESLEQAFLFDNVARWLLPLFQYTFVDQAVQPCLGLRT